MERSFGGYTLYGKDGVMLLLPSPVAQALQDAWEAGELAQRTARQEAARDQLSQAQEAEKDDALSQDARQPSSQPPGDHSESTELSGLRVPVFRVQQFNAFKRRVRLVHDKDEKMRLEAILSQLNTAGNFRQFAQPAGTAGLEQLSRKFPNFVEVIDFVQAQVKLSHLRGLALRIPPILIYGPPGVGKTAFCRALAQELETVVDIVSFDTAVGVSQLLGLDKQWANTFHGKLFELVCLGKYANPILVLDEIDKAPRGFRDSPLTPLHTLLEEVSADRVKDVSLEFVFDASFVTYIATANELRHIPDTIVSRLRTFFVNRPLGKDAIMVCENVVAAALRESALSGVVTAGRSVVVALAHLNPREINGALREMIAYAAINGRTELIAADVPAWAREEGDSAGSFLH